MHFSAHRPRGHRRCIFRRIVLTTFATWFLNFLARHNRTPFSMPQLTTLSCARAAFLASFVCSSAVTAPQITFKPCSPYYGRSGRSNKDRPQYQLRKTLTSQKDVARETCNRPPITTTPEGQSIPANLHSCKDHATLLPSDEKNVKLRKITGIPIAWNTQSFYTLRRSWHTHGCLGTTGRLHQPMQPKTNSRTLAKYAGPLF